MDLLWVMGRGEVLASRLCGCEGVAVSWVLGCWFFARCLLPWWDVWHVFGFEFILYVSMQRSASWSCSVFS